MNDTTQQSTLLHELALRAKDGEQQALEQLLAHAELRQVIYKIANDRVGQTNADDVYQNVLICITQKIRTWQATADITAWIDRITRNTCVDFFRKSKAARLIITNTLPEQAAEPEQFQYVTRQQMETITQNVLQEMGTECQRLLHAYLIEGAEKREIMENANLPKSTFHRKWKGCYETLLQKIQNFCAGRGKQSQHATSLG